MNDYWLGVLSLPLLLIALVLCWIVLLLLARVVEKLGATIWLLRGKDAKRGQRAALAGIVFAAHRVLAISLGDTAIYVVSGHNAEEAGEAMQRLSRMSRVQLRQQKNARASSDQFDVPVS